MFKKELIVYEKSAESKPKIKNPEEQQLAKCDENENEKYGIKTVKNSKQTEDDGEFILTLRKK